MLGRCKTLPNFHRAGVPRIQRETKTRSGNDPRNVRAIAPKMFAVPNNEKCSVKAYKVYAEKRPAEMKTDDAAFYLAVNNVKSGSGKPWFKKSPVGAGAIIRDGDQGGKRPGGETGSPLLGQCVMRRRTGTSAPSALPVQLMAAKNLLSTNRKWHFLSLFLSYQ